MKKSVMWALGGLVAVSLVGTASYEVFGGYNVAADDPHWQVTRRVIELVRDQSIAARADSVTVPDLADRGLIELGAGHYAAMCEDCHMAPDVAENELRRGLYPKPPNLARESAHSPAETFWIIKHGIKMSAMPAWGVTHDDDSIWGLVAFLRQLPTLDAKAYAVLTEAGGDDDDDHGHHDHGDHDHSELVPVEADNIGTAGLPEVPHSHADGGQHRP
jgi:mono/diheme cytochrome c family protein